MTESESDNQLKVIGAGWGRTGTSSFKVAMELLGECNVHEASL